MTSGFETKPEELATAAGKIGDAIKESEAIQWPLPDADYGHEHLKSSWRGFMKEAENAAKDLRSAGHEITMQLYKTSGDYESAEQRAKHGLDKVGRQLEGGWRDGSRIGIGFGSSDPGGDIRDRGFVPRSISDRLNPDGTVEDGGE